METKETIIQIVSGAQFYQWGMPNNDDNGLVHRFLRQSHGTFQYLNNLQIDNQKHFAELWMGIHPLLPSQRKDNGQPLTADSQINIPFLFKVLSVATALSIQVHPNKQQAEKLHQQFPAIYVDNNHKPEFTVSLDDFQALSGFATKQTILERLERNPQLVESIGKKILDQFEAATQNDEGLILKQIVFKILSLSQQDLETLCQSIVLPVSDCDAIYDLQRQYPNDVGLIFVLLMNHIRLKKGEALTMDAGVLHAYLRGNCIECMANSDNVVRAGFTPKLKDKDTLMDISIFETGQTNRVQPQLIESKEGVQVNLYKTHYTEFMCYSIQLGEEATINPLSLEHQSIIICVEGKGGILTEIQSKQISEGDTYFAKAGSLIRLTSQGSLTAYICTSQ